MKIYLLLMLIASSGLHAAQELPFECSLPYNPDSINVPTYNANEFNEILVSNTQEFRQALVETAQNGMNDKIILANGIYKTSEINGGSFTFADSESFGLTIEGESAEGVVLDGGGEDIILDIFATESPNIRINKVTLKNGYGEKGAAIYFKVTTSRNGNIQVYNSCILNNKSTEQAAAINATGSWTTLTNVYIANNISSGNAVINSFETFSIDKTIITNNVSTGGLIYSANRGGVITNSNVSDNRVQDSIVYGRFRIFTENSIFADNEGMALIKTGSGSNSSSINLINSIFNNNVVQSPLVDTSGKLTSLNTSFIGNSQGLIAGELNVFNSIFYMNTGNDIEVNPDSIALGFIKNSYFDETGMPLTIDYENNISNDKNVFFVNPTDDDYHFSASSSLIDAGTTDLDDITLPSTDLDGNSRLSGGGIDIGPYEFSTTRPTIVSFTYTGAAKELSELTFDLEYTLADDGRILNNIVYDYSNDGTWSVENTNTFDTAGAYTVNAKIIDSKGEFTLTTLTINIAEISLEDKLLTYLSVFDTERILPIINADIANKISVATSTGIAAGKQLVQDDPSAYGINVVAPLSNAKIQSLSEGWEMISVPSKIEDMTIFDDAKIVWYFNNESQTWSAYSSNSTIIEELQDQGIAILTVIEAGSGIWLEM